MSLSPDLRRRLNAYLDDEMSLNAPDGVVSDVLAAVGRTRRRPAWRIPERWFPMPLALRLAVVPRALIYLLLLALLVAMLGAGGLVVGSLRNAAVTLPPPTGPARNGLIAFDSGGDIWVMQPDGTGRRQLTSGPEIDVAPTWSPDGTRLAFWRYPPLPSDPPSGFLEARYTSHIATGTGSLRVVGADGNELAVLTEDWSPGDLTALGLSWSPDSTRVAVSLPKRGIPCLYVRSAGHASDLILGCGETPAWSPDGRRIAFKSADSLKLVDLGTSEERTLVSGGEGQWSYLRPRWSTDGKQLLYHVGPAQHDIRTFDTTTEQESLISIDQSDEYWPSWSPDGSRIAFSRVLTSSANTPRFVVADADGTGATLVGDVPEGSGMDAAWSPDGTLLLGGRPSETRADAWDIRLLDAESAGPPVQVFTLEDSYGTTSWQRLAP